MGNDFFLGDKLDPAITADRLTLQFRKWLRESQGYQGNIFFPEGE